MEPVDGLHDALELLGDRWSLLIVAALADGELAYNELSNRVGARGRTIAPNILASRLRHLEAARLVASRPYQERPRRLQYALTADGSELLPALGALRTWALRNAGTGAGRADAGSGGHEHVHSVCGTPVQWRPWCPTCERAADEPAAVWV